MEPLPPDAADAGILRPVTATIPPIRPRVLATYAMPQLVVDQFRRFADLTVLDGINDPDEVLAQCEGYDALVCTLMNRISRDFVARLPETIRLVATYSVGFDHVDVAALEERKIVVINTPDVLTQATADITWLLLLGAARRSWEAQMMLREGRWRGWEPTQLLGSDMHGKTLGILGFGRIGRAVAERARGFGMAVRTYQRPARSEEARSAPLSDHITLCGSLEEVLATSDCVSLHLPLNTETAGWLNAQRIETMIPGAVLINTARGALIDEGALVEALGNGRIAAAGLDVFVNEPCISPELLAAPNTYFLPHIGSATHGARTAMGLSLARDTFAFFFGDSMTCRVRVVP